MQGSRENEGCREAWADESRRSEAQKKKKSRRKERAKRIKRGKRAREVAVGERSGGKSDAVMSMG